MDPNYKNFLAWKKSSMGREYLQQKNEEELDTLKQKSKIKFS